MLFLVLPTKYGFPVKNTKEVIFNCFWIFLVTIKMYCSMPYFFLIAPFTVM